MSASRNARRLELETRAYTAEEKLKEGSSNDTQTRAAIAAAELYMQALQLADNVRDKQRLSRKTKALIDRAEELKSMRQSILSETVTSNGNALDNFVPPRSTRELTTREQIILLEGSKLNGSQFKPWTSEPAPAEFQLCETGQLFKDAHEFSLSDNQSKHFVGWERPKQALAGIKQDLEQQGLCIPTMNKIGVWDIVQDVAPDCSVVASICVGLARTEGGHPRILGQTVYPYNYQANQPALSPNGKYVLRLYFNGCWRRVEVDDRLPASHSARVLHVHDRSHPGLLWPAIVEKAYMKIRGGYQFPGSNSGTDLAVIIGWIPEQVFLHDGEIDRNALWNELAPALDKGHIMLTLGTGRISRAEQKQLGLASEHDYAVLDLRGEGYEREVLLKNPWADGDVWKGATRAHPHPGHEDDIHNSDYELRKMKPGTFWMSYNNIYQYYEHMYLNWDPALFRYREDIHFTYRLDVEPDKKLLVNNPQFAISAIDQPEEIRILLNRHFRTGDYTTAQNGENGYISLYLCHQEGSRVLSSKDVMIRGPFVDSPNTLLRFTPRTRQAVTVVVVTQGLPLGKHNFTLSVFSNSRIQLGSVLETYSESSRMQGSWHKNNAGGSSDSPRYLQNPQYGLQLDEDTYMAIVLNLKSPSSNHLAHIRTKLTIVNSDGNRVCRLRDRDIAVHSGNYDSDTCYVEKRLSKGSYTIICSTFEIGELADFELSLFTGKQSTFGPRLRPLPSEDAGRLTVRAPPARFPQGSHRLIAPITVRTTTRVTIRIPQDEIGLDNGMYKLNIEQGIGALLEPIASSSSDHLPFSTLAVLRIEDIRLQKSALTDKNKRLWLSIERSGQSSSEDRSARPIQIEAVCEEEIEIGEWMSVDI